MFSQKFEDYIVVFKACGGPCRERYVRTFTSVVILANIHTVRVSLYKQAIKYAGSDDDMAVPLNINPSAWGHLNPSSYCDVGRLFYGVFKLWSKLQRKK